MLSLSVLILIFILGLVVVLVAVGIAFAVNWEKRSAVHSDPHRQSSFSERPSTIDLNLLKELSPQVAEALQNDKFIEAIKLYRDETGVGLKEAKAVIDGVRDGIAAPKPMEPDNLSSEIVEELQKGRKIAAIQLYREQTGADLRDAKAFIEAAQRKLGL